MPAQRFLIVSATTAVALGLALGVAYGRAGAAERSQPLAAGEPPARAVHLDALRVQVDSLQRENKELRRQVSNVEPKLNELERQVDELKRKLEGRGSAGPSRSDVGKRDYVEWQRFKEEVHRALEPELAQLQTLSTQYGGHVHEYAGKVSFGYANRATIDNMSPHTLFPFVDQSKTGKPSKPRETGGPR